MKEPRITYEKSNKILCGQLQTYFLHLIIIINGGTVWFSGTKVSGLEAALVTIASCYDTPLQRSGGLRVWLQAADCPGKWQRCGWKKQKLNVRKNYQRGNKKNAQHPRKARGCLGLRGVSSQAEEPWGCSGDIWDYTSCCKPGKQRLLSDHIRPSTPFRWAEPHNSTNNTTTNTTTPVCFTLKRQNQVSSGFLIPSGLVEQRVHTSAISGHKRASVLSDRQDGNTVCSSMMCERPKLKKCSERRKEKATVWSLANERRQSSQ